MNVSKEHKFTVVIIVSVLLAMGMIAGFISSFRGQEMAWLSAVLPILASVYPVYLGAHAYQKGQEMKQGKQAQNDDMA